MGNILQWDARIVEQLRWGGVNWERLGRLSRGSVERLAKITGGEIAGPDGRSMPIRVQMTQT